MSIERQSDAVAAIWDLFDDSVCVLPLPPGFVGVGRTQVSADGRVVVAGGSSPNQSDHALEWIDQEPRVLPSLSAQYAWPHAVNADGSVIVGAAVLNDHTRPVVWRDGQIQELPTLPGERGGAWALGVSADGRVILGNSDGSREDAGAVVWRDGLIESLHSQLNASALSSDGLTIALWGAEPPDYVHHIASRWRSSGTDDLGTASGDRWAFPSVLSEDGSIVAGWGGSAQAMIWDESHGSQLLHDALWSRYGVDTRGWCFGEVTGAANGANGLTVVGFGLNPDGAMVPWAVTLASPGVPPCSADFNGDGFLDFFDYDDFVAAYERGARRTDLNHDCFVDFFDYDAFVVAYEAGC